jgi:ceramide glucosyltransferase
MEGSGGLCLRITMPLTPGTVFTAVAAAGTAGSLFFYFLSVPGLAGFLSDRQRKQSQALRSDAALPAVSILKPLKGIDPGMWESFCSHCEQDYPEFQLVFGVSEISDPAVAMVERLRSKYPERAIELVVCGSTLGTNIKVSNLAQMTRAARHPVLVINDSDIRVPAKYLREVVAPLADESVGLVTCLYRGASSRTLGSRLEAVGIATDFVPGVLSARFLEKGLYFGMGSTLALAGRDLAAIGGFEGLLDYLADDYELGRRIAATGKRVELSASTVTTFLPAYTIRQFLTHQLRWWRTIRDARPWGYVGMVFTFGLPWAALTVVAAQGARWAWILLGMTLTARMAVAFGGSVLVLNERQFLGRALLVPLRDVIAPFLWLGGMLGNGIQWRGERFRLSKGRLTIVEPASRADWKK